MHSQLKQDELQYLEDHYRLCRQKESTQGELSIEGKLLIDPDKTYHYIKALQQKLNSSSIPATASLFSKRYSYLIAVNGLYAMSGFNKGMKLTLNNVYIQSYFDGDIWLPRLVLEELSETSPLEGMRNEWRDDVIKETFHHLNHVWACLSKVSNLSEQTLWENTALYVFWLYENQLLESESEWVKNRAMDDFSYLIHTAPGYLFGPYQENPLARFYREKTYSVKHNTYIRMRRTCCLSYQVNSKGQYCSTCPISKDN
jgi:ferric iron reductase protein FhuF